MVMGLYFLNITEQARFLDELAVPYSVVNLRDDAPALNPVRVICALHIVSTNTRLVPFRNRRPTLIERHPMPTLTHTLIALALGTLATRTTGRSTGRHLLQNGMSSSSGTPPAGSFEGCSGFEKSDVGLGMSEGSGSPIVCWR